MSELFYLPFRSEFQLDGPTLASATLEFFEYPNNTPIDVYQDLARAIAVGNTLLADAAGQFPLPIYLDPSIAYRIVLTGSNGAPIAERSPYVLVKQAQMPTPYDFGAQGGYETLSEARFGIDDTVAIQALLAAWAEYPAMVPNFGGRYWKVSQTIRFAQDETHTAAYFIAGLFVAAPDSVGINLVEVSMRYAAWQGKLGAFGTDGNDYADRTWRIGIYIDNSSRIRAPDGWVAESFLRDGMSVIEVNGGVGNNDNNVAINIGPGRAHSCGSPLGQAQILQQDFELLSKNGVANSVRQSSVLNMSGPVPSEIAVDDICYFRHSDVKNHIGDNTQRSFVISDKYLWQSGYELVISPDQGDYEIMPFNRVEFAVAPAVVFDVTIERDDPYVVTEINGTELSLFPWLPNAIAIGDTGQLTYGHGAGLRLEGADTATSQFGRVEGLHCGSVLRIGSLYAGSFDGVLSQASGCALSVGDPVASGCLGPQLRSFHSENTVFDVIFLSTDQARLDLPAPSAMGTQTSDATGEIFGQVFKIAARRRDDTYRPGFAALSGVTLHGVHSPIPMRSGPLRGASAGTISLSNYPHERFFAQKASEETTVELRWFDVLDEKMPGYNYCNAILYGSGEHGGPSDVTNITIHSVDVVSPITINGLPSFDSNGLPSVVIPASAYPLHIVAVMDNSISTAKNWLVSWHYLRSNNRRLLTASLDADPPLINALGTWTQDIALPGAALGDLLVVSFNISLQGLMLTAYVSNVDLVTLVLFNPTATAIDLSLGTFRVALRSG
jgi:hypothetical protein